ncbi:hypothetical protein IRZ71_10635 [Flavobacterium sp. ANB]|uniref:hypothetical protein n=1 Tax=unclassified Flavobacterium TaxID=196869 RepID=UPI0012B8121A|nr:MULTISPECIES: hypothetical protein [unclassified Flavobacterium]MBF4516805.1 hypothetical protein [Flavobacterium sp. ANB]MTD69299.1 hypothetical protein [Flavobacterium sp. LC2016-13]
MKKTIIISVIIIILLYAFKQLIYNPYKWKKAVNTPEHKLQLGSFIFSKQRGPNGSQSIENKYFIFKVIEINGDYVRLSVIRQLSQKNKLLQSDFSMTKDAYKDLKQNIKKLTITPIIREDLYKEGASYTINDYLLGKYPSLAKSRYYFEELPENRKNLPLPADGFERQEYFTMLYSKQEIIKNAELVPWILNNSPNPELAPRLSKNIDLILN